VGLSGGDLALQVGDQELRTPNALIKSPALDPDEPATGSGRAVRAVG
jgi:hypothetical protein